MSSWVLAIHMKRLVQKTFGLIKIILWFTFCKPGLLRRAESNNLIEAEQQYLQKRLLLAASLL